MRSLGSLGITEKAAPLFERLDVFYDSSSRSAAMNMAIDEALFVSATRPCIRFYGWDHAALSFGYFGKFSDVPSEESIRDVVRRWTGGGIVLHDSDLTYGLVIPATGLGNVSPLDLYTRVHRAMCDVLLQSGIPAKLAGVASPKISEACFANPVRADVVSGEKKIAGAAQRRNRRGLLQQGSIRYENLPADFSERLASALCPVHKTHPMRNGIVEHAQAIAEQKYTQRAWLERR